MKTVLTMIAVLALATVAQADVVVEVDPGVDVGGGLTSYTVRLVGDTEANKATAWDGAFSGPMNQLWLMGGAMTTPTMTNASYLGAEIVKDSHFLLADDELLVARLPNETLIKLDGAFAIAPAYQLMNRPLAQIVLAPGEEVVMSGMAADITGAEFDTSVTIPEPMTMTLLAIGGLALIRRRRA